MTTILVMDEDQAIRKLYAKELSEEGYEVVTCGNAAGLIEVIGRKNPDIVLMEVLLSNRDGLDLLQDISYAFRYIPVILCTAYPAFREDLRSIAAYGFVVKSLSLKELKTMIEEVLEGRPLPPSSQPSAQGDRHKPMNQVIFPWNKAR